MAKKGKIYHFRKICILVFCYIFNQNAGLHTYIIVNFRMHLNKIVVWYYHNLEFVLWELVYIAKDMYYFNITAGKRVKPKCNRIDI